MARTRTETKAKKERKFVDITFDCDNDTLKRLNKIADLAAVTLSQTVSVILALYVNEIKEIKGEGFGKKSPEEWTKDKEGKLKKSRVVV